MRTKETRLMKSNAVTTMPARWASYGTFITTCGFTYHGPKGEIGFDPKLSKENFNAAFTAAEGWGTYSELRTVGEQKHTLTLKHGNLSLQQITVSKPEKVKTASINLDNEKITAKAEQHGTTVKIILEKRIDITPGQMLIVLI
jgi:non-lysosomal glucosylceramidase